jgi:phospholipid/cholesterol/gamma-HCH transport system substrate-binding protein
MLGAIVIVFIAAVSIREVSFLGGSYLLKAKFNFTEGLKSSSPVRFCGVDVGEIKRLEVRGNEENNSPIVYVYIKIAKNVKIPKDSQFFINSLSLFGEKYLEIIPPKKVEGFLNEGAEVQGMPAVPLFEIMSAFHKTMAQVDTFIKDAEMGDSLKNIVLNVKGVTENVERATDDFKIIMHGVKQGEGTLGRFLYDDSVYTKTEELIDELKANPWKLLHKPKKTRKQSDTRKKSNIGF